MEDDRANAPHGIGFKCPWDEQDAAGTTNDQNKGALRAKKGGGLIKRSGRKERDETGVTYDDSRICGGGCGTSDDADATDADDDIDAIHRAIRVFAIVRDAADPRVLVAFDEYPRRMLFLGMEGGAMFRLSPGTNDRIERERERTRRFGRRRLGPRGA